MLTIRTIGTRSPFRPEAAISLYHRNSNSSGYFLRPYYPVNTSAPEIDSFQLSFNTSHFSSDTDSRRRVTTFLKATTGDGGGKRSVKEEEDSEDGVSLGTMKLPLDTDLVRFEALLFQWANSLCQGSNLPMPMPLKVDKIKRGARIGFMTIGDGDTQVLVYIDFLVFPSGDNSGSGSGPVFRAIRNGLKKAETPPGEPRIMRSLLEALKKSVELARA